MSVGSSAAAQSHAHQQQQQQHQEPEDQEDLFPPDNFSMVDAGIYRSEDPCYTCCDASMCFRSAAVFVDWWKQGGSELCRS